MDHGSRCSMARAFLAVWLSGFRWMGSTDAKSAFLARRLCDAVTDIAISCQSARAFPVLRRITVGILATLIEKTGFHDGAFMRSNCSAN